MHKHLPDRRFKSDDELQLHLVKPRFTDPEIEIIEAEAAMRHGGKLASMVREAAMLGIEVMRERRQQMLDRLNAGERLGTDENNELVRLLAQMAEQNIADSRSVAKREMA